VTLQDSEPGVVKKGKLKILGQVEGARASTAKSNSP
jgi:hypothetical protein